jgi:hypothetical protein
MSKRPPQQLQPKVFYTVRDIADCLGYTKPGARKFLLRLNIPIQYIGNKLVIYLSDIQSYQPDLYASIMIFNDLAASQNSYLNDTTDQRRED